MKELRTERLLLNSLEPGDAPGIFALRSDPVVNEYLERTAATKIDEAISFIDKIREATEKGDSYYWAIRLHSAPKLIGTICVWNFSDDKTIAEIGYELMPAFQGKGIMYEALGRVREFCFEELKLSKLEAFTHAENKASSQLLEKRGFLHEPGRTDPYNSLNKVFILANTIT